MEAGSPTPSSTGKSWRWTSDDSAPPPFAVGQPLLRRPRHQFSLDASTDGRQVTVRLRGGGRGGRSPSSRRFGTFGGLFDAAGFQVVDAGGSWKVARVGRTLRPRREPVRSQVRGGVRVSRARSPRDGGAASCCRPTDVSFGYARPAGPARRVDRRAGAAASSASSARTAPARRPCCGCWRGRGSRKRTDDARRRPISSLSRAALARRMAVVPQETHLAFDYTVLEVVLMGRYPHLGAFEIEGPADFAAAREALAATGTRRSRTARSRRSAAARSSGSSSRRRWRRSPARRPAPGGAILLLDEPTAALDLAYQLEIASLLRDLHGSAAAVDRPLDARPRTSPPACARTLVLLKAGRGARGRPDRRRADAGARARALRRRGRDRPASRHGRTPGRHADPPGRPGARAVTGQSAGSCADRRLLVFGGAARWRRSSPRRSSDRPRSACARAFDPSIPFADNVDAQIFFVARLPRTLAGALVGGALAAAGVVFQGLLRNPLATPFTLGVSAGAALGAMLAITFGWTLGGIGIPAVPLASFAGSLARRRDRLRAGARAAPRALDQHAAARRRDDERVLLGADPVRAVLRRLRRDLPDAALADGRSRRQQLPAARGGAAAAAWSRSRCSPGWRGRSTCSASDRTAPRRAASTSRARSARRSSARRWPPARRCRSAARSASSASSCRTWSGCWSARITGSCCRRRRSSARRSWSAATSLARTIMAPVELPVGVITALIGGPFFLWLLIRRASINARRSRVRSRRALGFGASIGSELNSQRLRRIRPLVRMVLHRGRGRTNRRRRGARDEALRRIAAMRRSR